MWHRIKINLLTLIFAAVSIELSAQSTEAGLYSETANLSTTTEFERFNSEFKFLRVTTDTLNLNVAQTNWVVYKRKEPTGVYLLTLSLRGKIFYREFYQGKVNLDDDGNQWLIDQLYVKADSSILTRIKSDDVVLKIDHLTRYPERSTFGYACSASGSMPNEGMVMMEMVIAKDTTQLISWLMSINPVKQAYAFLGLTKL